MKRRILLLIAALLVLFCLPVKAESAELYAQYWEDSGASSLYDTLPSETQALLERWGISPEEWQHFLDWQPKEILQSFLSLFSSQLREPMAMLCALVGLMLLATWYESFGNGLNVSVMGQVFRTVEVLAVCSAVSVPLTACLQSATEAVESVRVFMLSFVPVYAAVLLTGGRAAASVGYRTVLLTAGEWMADAVTRIVLPLSTCCLALEMVGSPGQTGGIVRCIRKIVTWFLVGAATLFVGLLTLKSGLGTAADSVGIRVAKFSLTEWIPIVGSALGEALLAVKNCMGLLRGTVGIFGIAATAAIVAPPMAKCGCWLLCMGIAASVAEIFELTSIRQLIDGLISVVRIAVAVLATCALMMISSTAVVMGGV